MRFSRANKVGYWVFALLAGVTLYPVLIVGTRWLPIWNGSRPRAWDGTGHFGVASLYSQHVFPDTFGWLPEYFAGMPFPNFYPPAFYFCVALFHQAGLTLESSFKFWLIAPLVAMPAAVWLLGYLVSERSWLVATCSAFALAPLLLDYRLYRPIGLDYLSTFGIGLYSQPLGFVLLIVWLGLFLSLRDQRARFIASSAFLALTVLANFFNGITAGLFVFVSLAFGVASWVRSQTADDRRSALVALAVQAGIAATAVALTAFWTFPVVESYDYFVTRPYSVPAGEMVAPAMIAWYALAIIGAVYWFRAPTRCTFVYLVGCLCLAGLVAFAGAIAPPWFPLQATRFAGTLNFLLVVPVGYCLSLGIRFVARLLNEDIVHSQDGQLAEGIREGFRRAPYAWTASVLALAAAAWVITPSHFVQSFYSSTNGKAVNEVLRFAADHRDGRYAVENARLDDLWLPLDGRAMSSFLGAQGNEALSIVFREASPHSLFFNPLVNSWSAAPDNFGLSSMLAADIDYASASPEVQLQRLQRLGVKYVVVASPDVKQRFGAEAIVERHEDFGNWTVFELRGASAQRVEIAPFRPALYVGRLSFKLRYSSEYSFTRFAEEQVADDWWDVLLACSPESRLDRLVDLGQFGSLVVDTYEADDWRAACDRIREFSSSRLVVLLSSDTELFGYLAAELQGIPNVVIVHRETTDRGEPLVAERPSASFASNPVRTVWKEIRRNMDIHKVRSPDGGVELGSAELRNDVDIMLTSPSDGESTPILIRNTFHPNWTDTEGSNLYAVTPFFTLAFTNSQARLRFQRSTSDYVGLWMSILVASGLTVSAAYLLGMKLARYSRSERVKHPAASVSAAGSRPLEVERRPGAKRTRRRHSARR